MCGSVRVHARVDLVDILQNLNYFDIKVIIKATMAMHYLIHTFINVCVSVVFVHTYTHMNYKNNIFACSS